MVIEADFVVSARSPATSPTPPLGPRLPAARRAPPTRPTPRATTSSRSRRPPRTQSNASALQGAGDVAMLFHATPQAKAFMKYLASPEPAEIWAHLGGFASPNKLVPLSSYPDPVTQADASELAARHRLRVQPRRPADRLGARPVGRHAQLREEPELVEHHLHRGDHAEAGHRCDGRLRRPVRTTSRNGLGTVLVIVYRA